MSAADARLLSCEERAVNDDKLMERLRLTQATAQLPRRLARGLVGGNTRWAPQPSAELSAEGLERTVCAVGAALRRHGAAEGRQSQARRRQSLMRGGARR